MDREQFLDNLFSDGASQVMNYWNGKKAKYTILDDNFAVSAKGVCSVKNVRYDKSIDCNLYHIEDVNTGEYKVIDQFHIELEEGC